VKNFTGELTQVSYGEEWNEFIDLDVDYGGGAVISGNEINSMAGMTANKYNGQTCFVQYRGGSVDGRIFHVVVNTATTIYFEENIATAGLADTDEISITTHGVLPTSTAEYFGDVSESDLPEPNVEYKSHHIHGHANQPEEKSATAVGIEYDATMPLELLNGKLLIYALGYCSDVASNYGAGSETLDRAAYIGETIIDVSDGTDFTVNDYIEIGTSTEGQEIRKVTAKSTNLLTLDKPLRRYHPITTSTVKECDIGTAKPVLHTIKPAYMVPRFSLEACFKEQDPSHKTNDMVIFYNGLIGTGIAFKSAMKETLKCDLGVNGLDATLDTRARTTTVSVTDWGQDEFVCADSEVSINSIVYGQVDTANFGTTLNAKPYQSHNNDTGIKPFGHLMEGWDHKCEMDILAHNKNFWNLVNNKTKFDAYIYYERDSTDDHLKFHFKNCYCKKAPFSLPERAEVKQSLDIHVGQFYIEVTDEIPYY